MHWLCRQGGGVHQTMRLIAGMNTNHSYSQPLIPLFSPRGSAASWLQQPQCWHLLQKDNHRCQLALQPHTQPPCVHVQQW